MSGGDFYPSGGEHQAAPFPHTFDIARRIARHTGNPYMDPDIYVGKNGVFDFAIEIANELHSGTAIMHLKHIPEGVDGQKSKLPIQAIEPIGHFDPAEQAWCLYEEYTGRDVNQQGDLLAHIQHLKSVRDQDMDVRILDHQPHINLWDPRTIAARISMDYLIRGSGLRTNLIDRSPIRPDGLQLAYDDATTATLAITSEFAATLLKDVDTTVDDLLTSYAQDVHITPTLSVVYSGVIARYGSFQKRTDHTIPIAKLIDAASDTWQPDTAVIGAGAWHTIRFAPTVLQDYKHHNRQFLLEHTAIGYNLHDSFALS